MPQRRLPLEHAYWLVTWTTFGTWLPGDPRGSTSALRDAEGKRVRFNIPGTPAAPPGPELQRWSAARRRDPEVHLTRADAGILVGQFQETAATREWLLVAAAVMHNHVHLIVGTNGELDPSDLLRDFKRSASWALNTRGGSPVRRWWTKSGSRRQLRTEANVIAAIEYVRDQYRPLTVWFDAERTGE